MYIKLKKFTSMKATGLLIVLIFVIISFISCATSKTVTSYNAKNISKYSYVVFGDDVVGDNGLDDVMMAVQNEIAQTRLRVLTSQEAATKIESGEFVLSPRIHITTEKWDGGHTYITITFCDYDTGQSVIVLKSSGIGLSITHDQKIAIKAIRKELRKAFVL